MELGRRIKELRRTLGYTQQEVADTLNLKRQTIAAYEIGTVTPSERTISDICREFKVNEIWLRTGDGEPFQKMTRKESIAAFMGEILVAENDDIRFRIIDILSRLTVDDWRFIEKRLLKLVKESEEDQNKEKSHP